MNRAAVFAHYDKDNLIDDYVVYYLKALRGLCDKLVFVTCNEISDVEMAKLDGLVDFTIAEKHDEYDFGSYKRGFLYLQDAGHLANTDELIFANDSCFAPLYPLEPIFEKMENQGCDFWGITKNRFGADKKDDKFFTVIRPHIQSYFLVFTKKVFQEPVFADFIKSIKHHEQKMDIIINYEIGLSELLVNNGFKDDTYVKDYYRFNHTLYSFWRELITKSKLPLIKCSIFRLVNHDITTISGWEKFIQKHTNYPVSLIKKNIERTAVKELSTNIVPSYLKALHFSIIGRLPAVLKRKTIVLTRKYLPFMKD